MKNVLANFVAVIIVAIFLSFLMSYPLMLLWNGCLVPAVTVLQEVSWLQMWGIAILVGFFGAKVSK